MCAHFRAGNKAVAHVLPPVRIEAGFLAINVGVENHGLHNRRAITDDQGHPRDVRHGGLEPRLREEMSDGEIFKAIDPPISAKERNT